MGGLLYLNVGFLVTRAMDEFSRSVVALILLPSSASDLSFFHSREEELLETFEKKQH